MGITSRTVHRASVEYLSFYDILGTKWLYLHVRNCVSRSCRQNIVLFDVTASGIHGYHSAINVDIHTYCDSEILYTPHVCHFYQSICPQLQESFSLDGKVTGSLKLADTEFSSGELCTVTGWGRTKEVHV